MSWPAVTSAASYQLRYATSSGGGTWATASSPHTITGLSPGTSYYVGVRAKDASGNEGPVTEATQTTLTLNAPTSVTFSEVSTNSLKVSWTNVTGAASYQVRYGTSSGGGLWETADSPHTITGLSPTTPYYVGVRGRDSSNNNGEITEIQTRTLLALPENLRYPTNLCCGEWGEDRLTIYWDGVPRI